MTVEATDIGSDDIQGLFEWLKSEEAGELQRDLEERIMRFLFNHEESPLFEQGSRS